MIGNRARKAFLNRERKDYRKFKKLSDSQLQVIVDKLPVKPPIWHKLRHHQKVCFVIGATTRRFAFLADTGTGKTLLSIALARYFRKAKVVKQVLVLVPNRVNKSEWAREIRKHSPNTEYCVLTGSSDHKWQQLNTTQALLVIDTYMGFIRMVCTLKKHKRKKRNVLRPNLTLVKRVMNKFQGLILDEATAVKNKGTLPYRVCRKISMVAKSVFTLTATPFGRDPTDLWAQMYLVDHGETLGETLGLFRAIFFKTKINYWGGYEHKFIKKMDGLLNTVLANRSIRYTADQSDLPTLVPIYKFVSLPEDAQAYYDKAKATIIEAKGNYREMKNAFLRMRQISSGFVGYYDDDEGVKASFEFPKNPKLEMLMSVVTTITEYKIVICAEYNISVQKICQELKAEDIGYVALYGKVKDPDPVLHQFDNDPKCRVLVLSNAMAIGLNLQVARYIMFYESPVSPIVRKQAVRRVERQESAHQKVFQYDFVTRGTFDLRILQYLREGKNLFDSIIEGEIGP